jgi:hypothetical protein
VSIAKNYKMAQIKAHPEEPTMWPSFCSPKKSPEEKTDFDDFDKCVLTLRSVIITICAMYSNSQQRWILPTECTIYGFHMVLRVNYFLKQN